MLLVEANGIDTNLQNQPRYEEDDADYRTAMTAELLHSFPPVNDGKYACYSVAADSPFANLARSIELQVFLDTFGNDSQIMHEEYGPYEEASSFFIVVNTEEKQAAGALRVIQNSEAGFMTLNDIQKPPLEFSPDSVRMEYGINDLEKCWDVGTLAVLDGYKGKDSDLMPSTTLYRALYAASTAAGIEHFISIIDVKAYKQLKLLGIPFKPMLGSGAFPYMDSKKSYAAYGNVSKFYDSMDAYQQRLSANMLSMLKPYMSRLMDGDDVPSSQPTESKL